MLVDFSAYLGNWPFYQLPVQSGKGLVAVLDRVGIQAAFVSLIDTAFLFDPRQGQERLSRLTDGCRGRLLPVGTVDPTLPCWQDDLCESFERYDFAGCRLYPGYHGYAVNCSEAVTLARLLADYERPLFVPFFIEEDRFQHPAIDISPHSLDQVADLIRQAPDTTIVLNSVPVEQAATLLGTPDLPLDHVFIDVNAMDKPFDGLVQVIQTYGSGRLVYGSQVPFLYPEATLALVREAQLTSPGATAILDHNWRSSGALQRLLDRARDG